MSKADNDQKIDWPVILFIFVVLPTAFTIGGTWVGISILMFGVVALGWHKRHEGPCPTNKK